MKVTGIILLVMGLFNLIISLTLFLPNGQPDIAASSIRGGLIFPVIGGLLVHLAKKRKIARERRRKWDK